MLNINILDKTFDPYDSVSYRNTPKYIKWKRNIDLSDNICFFTEDCIREIDKFRFDRKIAWLIEPPEINPGIYDYIIHNSHKFTDILTYRNDFLLNNNFKLYLIGGCWIKLDDYGIHEKNKNISIISSSKRGLKGYNLRHEVINKFKNIDVYGLGYNPIENKAEALKNYRYSIVIENTKRDYYFTEKIIDCFVTGTIPIYYGCPSISKFFDKNGILEFDNIKELEDILPNLNDSTYIDKIESIKYNFEKAKEYTIAEDYIYKNILEKI